MRLRQTVTLTITYDPLEPWPGTPVPGDKAPPAEWDWADLLDEPDVIVDLWSDLEVVRDEP